MYFLFFDCYYLQYYSSTEQLCDRLRLDLVWEESQNKNLQRESQQEENKRVRKQNLGVNLSIKVYEEMKNVNIDRCFSHVLSNAQCLFCFYFEHTASGEQPPDMMVMARKQNMKAGPLILISADFVFALRWLYMVEFTTLNFNCMQSQIKVVDLFDLNSSALLCQGFFLRKL